MLAASERLDLSMAAVRLVLLSLAALARPSRGFIAPLCKPGKSALLRCIQTGAPEEDILAAAARLEWLNPSVFTGAVASDNLPGNWLMVYTTSDSIAGKSRPKIFQTPTPPEQLLDVAGGRACNSERVLGIKNAVDIALSPATRNRVDVRFETFRIGPLAIPAPDLTGSLDTIYLDEDMRSTSFVKGWPLLTAAARTATTRRSSSPLACSGPPSGPQRRFLAARDAEEGLRRPASAYPPRKPIAPPSPPLPPTNPQDQPRRQRQPLRVIAGVAPAGDRRRGLGWLEIQLVSTERYESQSCLVSVYQNAKQRTVHAWYGIHSSIVATEPSGVYVFTWCGW